MTTTQQALAKVEQTPTAMVEKYRDDFAQLLPSHVNVDTWIRLATGALRRDPNLALAARQSPGSFMQALSDAARRGLEPGTEQYYLTPRKVKGQWEVLGIVGYQGLIELIYRAGAVSSVVAEIVYSGDTFDYQPGRDDRPTHRVDWDAADRGALRLVYAYAVMKDGATSKVVVLNRHDIDRIKASSASAGSQYSPWKTHEGAMWLKSAVRQLAKWVPTSAEYITEQLRAVQKAHATVASDTATVPLGDLLADADDPRYDDETGEILDDVVDADIIDEDGAA
jgi:recombination protein RecT